MVQTTVSQIHSHVDRLSYLLLVTGPAYGSQQASSAYQFACELVKHHQLQSIFFFQEGVYNANPFISPASDEFDLVRAWEKLAKTHQVELHLCVSAALRRGIAESKEITSTVSSSFNISSLSELAAFMLSCDRVVQF